MHHQMKKYLLEICCAHIASVHAAKEAGADRTELCDNLWEGGTTPSIGFIKKAVTTGIDCYVLIRPRGGNFIYTNSEFDVMLEDIHWAKEMRAKGIVSGALLANGEIDIEKTLKLIEAADPLPFTFHRAFDLCVDPFSGLQDLIYCGVSTVLSSGQANSALEGLACIQQLEKKAAGQIQIMPGGGINQNNIQDFLYKTECRAFHLSAKTWVAQSKNPQKPPMNGSTSIPEDGIYQSSSEEIQKIKNILNQYEI
jgi:copper homeostasis protein